MGRHKRDGGGDRDGGGGGARNGTVGCGGPREGLHPGRPGARRLPNNAADRSQHAVHFIEITALTPYKSKGSLSMLPNTLPPWLGTGTPPGRPVSPILRTGSCVPRRVMAHGPTPNQPDRCCNTLRPQACCHERPQYYQLPAGTCLNAIWPQIARNAPVSLPSRGSSLPSWGELSGEPPDSQPLRWTGAASRAQHTPPPQSTWRRFAFRLRNIIIAITATEGLLLSPSALACMHACISAFVPLLLGNKVPRATASLIHSCTQGRFDQATRSHPVALRPLPSVLHASYHRVCCLAVPVRPYGAAWVAVPSCPRPWPTKSPAGPGVCDFLSEEGSSTNNCQIDLLTLLLLSTFPPSKRIKAVSCADGCRSAPGAASTAAASMLVAPSCDQVGNLKHCI